MAGLAGEIRQALEASADDATRRKFERIVPGAEVLGVRVPEVRAVAARIRSEHPELTLDAACALLDRFANRPIREEMLVGIFVLARFGKAVEGVRWTRIAGWTRSLDNWEVCDQLAANVAARVVHANPKYVASLTRLAAARNPWVRRFALVTHRPDGGGGGGAVLAQQLERRLLRHAVELLGVRGIHLVDVIPRHAHHGVAFCQRLGQLHLDRVHGRDVVHEHAHCARPWGCGFATPHR